MSSPSSYEPDFQEDEPEQTQQTQLSTQQYSQSAAEETDSNSHLWGFLLPCSPRLRHLEFWRSRRSYMIGRGNDSEIRLLGPRISASILFRRCPLAHFLTLWTRSVIRQQTLHYPVGWGGCKLCSGHRHVNEWDLCTLDTERCRAAF